MKIMKGSFDIVGASADALSLSFKPFVMLFIAKIIFKYTFYTFFRTLVGIRFSFAVGLSRSFSFLFGEIVKLFEDFL